ncbi:MAG: SIMPL domain-containing protein [Candidatus Melainabacteria bacterium]|nr:MAG: SIMPL domain-containing protein [Candidatus Melainabacteria bacterium]
MKKTLVALGTLSILLTGCAFSSSVVNVANGILSTYSEVEKEFMPDYANISISVETTDKNSLKASEENKIKNKKLLMQ